MALTSNQHVLDWVKEMEELMTPDKTIWIDGSEGQLRALREQAFATGELTELNQEELPGCVLHHTAKNDVARVEDRTFICTSNKADDCMMVNWMDPNEMKAKLLPLYKNVMAGRTMYVIPYCMGPIGSPFSKVGVEVTDSIYVVLNMDIMTRVGAVKVLRQLGDLQRFRARPACPCGHRPGEPLHRPVPRGQRHLVHQLRLRRKRAAGQKMLRTAHRQLPGLQGRLDG